MNMRALPVDRPGVASAPVELRADTRGNLAVGSLRKVFRDDFALTAVGLAAVDAQKWTVDLGTSMQLNAAASVLVVGTGNAANTETVLLCTERFTAPVRAVVGFQVSAKVAGEQVIAELLACDEAGQPIETEKVHVGTPLAGTSSTTLERVAVNAGNAVSTTAAGPTFTSATALELVLDNDEVALCAGAVNGGARSFLDLRQHNIPDPNATFALRIRIRHDGTYASAGQSVSLLFALVSDTAEVQAEITGGRGTAANVGISGTVAVSSAGGVRSGASATTDGAGTFTRLVSAANTNATLVSGAAAALCGLVAGNTSASWRYLKLFNKATAPVPGTDTPAITIPLPPGQTIPWNPPLYPRFSTGLGFAITGAPADNDTTAIGAGDVTLTILRP